MGSFLAEVLGTVALYVLMGLGLNIVVGYAGLLDLGYVAFFAIGAYATALLTSPGIGAGRGAQLLAGAPDRHPRWPPASGLIIGAPILRLRGDYLAIVTLGIGEIVRILLQSDALRTWMGGAQGILQIPPPALGDLNFFQPQVLYYPILLFVRPRCVLRVPASGLTGGPRLERDARGRGRGGGHRGEHDHLEAACLLARRRVRRAWPAPSSR